MSKISVPVWTPTTRPPNVFGVDMFLAALSVLAAIAVSVLVAVVGFFFGLSVAMWPLVFLVLFATNLMLASRLSDRDLHIVTIQVMAWRGWLGRRGVLLRRFGSWVLLVGGAMLAGAAEAGYGIHVRGSAVLDVDEMIVIGLGMLLGGVGLSAAVVPALVRKWAGDPKKDYYENHLEVDRILDDGMTVQLKSGGLVRLIRLSGMQYVTRPEDAQRAALNMRVQFLNAQRDTEVILRYFARKTRVDLGADGKYPSPTLQEIGDAEREFFANSWAYEFTIVLEVPPGQRHRRELADATASAMNNLQDFGAEIIRAAAEGPCPLTETLGDLVNGVYRALGPSSRSLAARLGTVPTDFHKGSGLIRTWDGVSDRLERIIVVKEWLEKTSGDLVRRIMEVECDLEVCVFAKPYGTKRAKALLWNQEKQAGILNFNPLVAADFQEVANLVDSGKEIYWRTQTTILVRARTQEALTEALERVEKILSQDNVVFAKDTEAALEEFYSRTPGRNFLARPMHLVSSNIAALMAMSSEPRGMDQSYFGDGPIRLFKSVRGQTYQFQYHVRLGREPIGHYMVIAPTDSGKTTLMMHLMGGMLRHRNTKGFVFDSQEGARFTIEAMGGNYYNLNDASGGVTLNPLQLEGTESNQAHLRRLFRMMAAVNDDESLEKIEEAVRKTLDIPDVMDRQLNKIYRSGFGAGAELKKGMRKWVTVDGRPGPYAFLMNAEFDSLARQMDETFLIGWNADQILKEPEVAAPVFEHIGHVVRSECKRGGYGFNIFVDEAANLFRNQAFRDEAAVMYREYRKLGGVVGVAFQEPSALRESGIGSAVFNNVSTIFLFPNSQAQREDYAELNLNSEQWDYIKGLSSINAAVERSVMLIKRDKSGGANAEESLILDVNLKPILGPLVRCYQSGPRAVRLMEELKDAYGTENCEWVRHA